MKKKLLLGLLMFTMASQMMMTPLHAAPAPEASTDAEITSQIPQLDEYLIEEGDPDSDDDNSGFLLDSEVTLIDPVTLQASPAAKQLNEQKTGKVVYGVNLRTEPSTSATIIRMAKKGEHVVILDKHNNNWYKVQDQNGTVGYMSADSKYIEVEATPSTAPSGSAADASGEETYVMAAASSSKSAKIEKVIKTGKKYKGTPYEFGSNRNNTKTFDCSDFVRHIYKEALGVVLPTDSRKQGAWIKSHSTAKTSISQLKRGDLMFFMTYKGSKKSNYSGINKSKQRITHVGVYLGNGQILHTYSKKSGGVRIDNIKNTTWEHRFLFGGSVL
ncbi:C40 family peptidase [Paenibacillus profundus]|uniref:C40 family peptidase n=1 Tax=Paenibacillus profundus TaxID=1173085 RepID=A0ABS8YF23_9BACL|nr:SH3 domain-containing C40 family peptidase [Paenibacillus profundus]MCE5168945.1 C40 family peptidase [Paenibacillus profundus]